MESDGVLALLRALYTRVRPDDATQAPLKRLLPAYERLLRPASSTATTDHDMMHALQRVRSALQSEPDLFDAVQMLDEHVDKCLEIDARDAKQTLSTSEALRLLLALSGGDDGHTFVLADPTRVCPDQETSASMPRLGERIHMGNVDIIAQTQQTLLQSTALPLAAEAVVGQFAFGSFAPTSAREAALWYPEVKAASAVQPSTDRTGVVSYMELDGFLRQLQATISGVPRLIDLPPLPRTNDSATLPVRTPSRKIDYLGTNSSPSGVESEVFFFDASKVIKSLPFDSPDDEGSATEASSEDMRSTASWLAMVREPHPSASWEELGGDLLGASVCYVSRSAPGASVLRHPVPLSLCHGSSASTVVEVDESELVEHATRALCGIQSAVFRLDVSTGSLRLPLKNVLIKSRTSSPSSLTSVLEEFRVAGTAFIRVEYLSVYYAQDPERGGKTAQALASALQLFLSAYQERITNDLKSASTASGFVSLIAMLAKTRAIRKELIELSRGLTGDAGSGSGYWRLLSGGEFPQGAALLNLLHQELLSWELEDATGAMAGLWRWLLVRAAAPFISLLSSYVASGETPFELDPFGEFRLSEFSTLQGLYEAPQLSIEWKEDLVPSFLQTSVSQVINIGRLQQMLSSILSHTELLPLDVLALGLKVAEAQSQLDCTRSLLLELSKRVEASCTSDMASSLSRRSLRSPMKSPRADENPDGEWIANKRKRLEYKRKSQQLQREMLDRLVEERTFIKGTDSHPGTEQPQISEHGEVLTGTHIPLDQADDNQRDYMKWRRDRAFRLSTSKVELAKLYEGDQENWRSARQESITLSSSTQTQHFPPQGSSIASSLAIEEPDVVMDEASGHDDIAQKPLSNMQRLPTNTVDIIGDDGLLWHPRIRAQHIPGGGGQDAMITLYPDRYLTPRQSTDIVATQRRSVMVTQAGRRDGLGAYDAMYGGGYTSSTHDAQELNTQSLEDGSASSNAIRDDVEDENGFAKEELAEAQENGDVDMAIYDAHIADEEEDNDVPRLTSSTSLPIDADIATQAENSALAILQSPTAFLRTTMSSEDSSAIHAALHPHTTASLLPSTPFQTLTKIALEDPIAMIHDIIDRMALQAMIVKLKLKSYLHWFHRVALMSEGLGMTIFTRDLHSELRSEQRVLLALPGRLTTSLALALLESRVVSSPAKLPSFEYRIESGFVSAVSSGPSIPSMVEVVQHVSLSYNLSLHLEAVLTARAVSDYQRVHQFLLLLRLTEHEVKHTWLAWRKSTLREDTLAASTRRACDLALHSTQALLNAFLETFTHQVLKATWTEFVNAMDSSDSVSQLREAHETFSSVACACCFLHEHQLQTLNALHTFVECAWSLGQLIETAEKHSASMDAFQLKLRDVVRTQATVMEALSSHLYRLEATTDRNLRDFVKHFLLRLNFNGYCADTTVEMP